MTVTITARECKFVVHMPTKTRDVPDVHLIKEQLHYSDGSIKPNIRYVKNYKRPIWVTKPAYRNHKQKKEWESQEKLLRKDSTQSSMLFDLAKLLDMQNNRSPQDILGNPYVYGADVHSSTFIKNQYKKEYPNANTPYSIATLDIETNVVDKSEDVLMCTTTFKNMIYTVVDKRFLEAGGTTLSHITKLIDENLSSYVEKDNIDIQVILADDPVEVIKMSFKKLHEWKPDLVAIWNMNYDIPKILSQLERYKADPKVYLCDPDTPFNLRVCEYKQGINKKVTASGKFMPLNPSSQWHTLILTASFYVIDAMCVYKRLRLAAQEEPSYSLEAILNKELDIGKLKFTEASGYSGLKWHQVMQISYRAQYVVYNIFDAYSMQKLEEKTKDLGYAMPTLVGDTPFNKLNSQPRMIADAFFFFLLESEDKVLAATGRSPAVSTVLDESADSDEDQEEFLPLDLKGWIVTLPSHYSAPGLRCIEEDDTIATNIRCYVSDLDASSAYPSAVLCANVSKENTVRELCAVKDVEEDIFRLQNLNLLSGGVNAVEYVETMLDGHGLTEICSLEALRNNT